MRREIETALDSRRNIVPLLFDGFSFDTPAVERQLTGSLAPLKRYNALTVHPDYFLDAMARLHNFLNVPLDAVLHPISLPTRSAAAADKAAADAAPPVEKSELMTRYLLERAYGAIDPDEKARLYTEVLRLNPSFSAAYYNRAHARRAKGDLGGALQDYNEAIRLSPNDTDALISRGNLHIKIGDFEKAIEDYNQAIAIEPRRYEALNNRGVILQAKGQRKNN